MKFSLSWLKKHLETDATLDQVVETMVRVGLEVEQVENPAEKLKDFSIGEVLHAEKHPDADKLKVCRVATKDGEKQIVCGAPNARTGIKIAYAAVGTYVPGIDVTLSKAKIRGVESFGMMCSARELELGDDHDGIIEAPQDAKVGEPVANLLGANDPVIDFEVTPNRPDTNGVMGVARDLAAAGLGRLVSESYNLPESDFASPQKIELEFDDDNKNACPAFGGIYVRGVKNGPSPQWLQDILRGIGLRPINALVDMTNYVSVDRARPLHVYDADKLNGPIRARLGRADDPSFVALDGKEYKPDETMTVIADEKNVLGFGGIMGGEDTGCTEQTKNVFIECAYFDPARTARTGRRTGIISDARYRFERGIDPQSITPGLAQAVAMVTDMCGGEPSRIELAGDPPAGTKKINFPPAEVKRLTGLDMSEEEMEKILSALDFEVERGATWTVTAPSARPDIEGKADLVEEIARIKGFDELPEATLPPLDAVERPKYSKAQDRVRLAKRALSGRGLLEAVTWSFCDGPVAALFGAGQSNPDLVLANPISSDLGVMRPSVLPGLVAAIGRNAARGRKNLALFEVGPAYITDQPDGQRTVAAGVRAGHAQRHWQENSTGDGVFASKADALNVLAAAGVQTGALMILETAPGHYHPGRSGILSMGPKNHLAYFGELHPRVMREMDVDGPLYAFEVILDKIPPGKLRPTKSKPALNASDLMPLSRDFAFVVTSDLPAENLLKAVRGAEKKLISNVALFDVYEGKGIEDGKKSLAIEVTLQPMEKTLTDEEIDAVSQRIIAQAEKATGATLRS